MISCAIASKLVLLKLKQNFGSSYCSLVVAVLYQVSLSCKVWLLVSGNSSAVASKLVL